MLLLSFCICQNSTYLGSRTIGWHRLVRPCSVENMLIWWYHRLNWFISHNGCQYFRPTDTRASWCGPSEAWIRSLRWPAGKRSLLQWRTAAVERILDPMGDKKWEKVQRTAINWHIGISIISRTGTYIFKRAISCYFQQESHQPWFFKITHIC